jgi:phage protein D
MQITLNQNELERAVKNHLMASGITGEIGKIDFTATRGSEGVVTTIDLADEEGEEDVVVVRKASPKKAPKEKAAPVAEKEADETTPVADDEAEADTADAELDVDATPESADTTVEAEPAPATGNPNSLFG